MLDDFRSFAAFCAEQSRSMQRPGEAYLRQHLGRFYETFRACRPVVPPGARILSAGAGDAYVENWFARACDAQVTVVDFPEAIQQRGPDYQRHAFRWIGMNLAAPQPLCVNEPFDVVFSFEIAEHLPVAPQEHIRSLSRSLKPGGRFVLTTPNLAHLPSVCRLLRGRPLLPEAELTFSPACYENEHVHRREYVAGEIVNAMGRAGLVHERTVYMSCINPLTLKGQVRRLYGLVPRWKKTMLLIGRKEQAAAV